MERNISFLFSLWIACLSFLYLLLSILIRGEEPRTTINWITLSAATLIGLVALLYTVRLYLDKKYDLKSARNVGIKDLEREIYKARGLYEKIRLEVKDNASSQIDRIIEEKRNRFLNIPSIAFHFANADQIRNFYNDYFKEPTIASLVSEITGEATGEIKGSIPQILESRMGGKDIEKWVSTIKLPDNSLNGMFLRYQRETIKSEQVSLGLEEVDIELTDLVAFDEDVEKLRKRFGFKIEEALLNKHKVKLKERAAERTLAKLEQATGWILIEGRFKIERQDTFYRCTYKHPVSEYLSDPIPPVLISTMIPDDSLEAGFTGNYAQSIGRLIPLKIYGQVWQPIDRTNGIYELQLTPLAIY